MDESGSGAGRSREPGRAFPRAFPRPLGPRLPAHRKRGGRRRRRPGGIRSPDRAPPVRRPAARTLAGAGRDEPRHRCAPPASPPPLRRGLAPGAGRDPGRPGARSPREPGARSRGALRAPRERELRLPAGARGTRSPPARGAPAPRRSRSQRGRGSRRHRDERGERPGSPPAGASRARGIRPRAVHPHGRAARASPRGARALPRLPARAGRERARGPSRRVGRGRDGCRRCLHGARGAAPRPRARGPLLPARGPEPEVLRCDERGPPRERAPRGSDHAREPGPAPGASERAPARARRDGADPRGPRGPGTAQARSRPLRAVTKRRSRTSTRRSLGRTGDGMNLWLAFALLGIAVAERLPRLRFEPSRLLRRCFATDLFYLATGAVGLGVALRHAGLGLAAAFGIGAAPLAALPAPLAVALATLLYDLGAYATHLLLHRIDWLWRFHAVHHSSRTLDWLATFRAHAVEHALRHLASPVALLLLGFPVGVVAAASAIYAAWAALNHANLRLELRWLEPVFVTPRLHRLHHVPGTSGANLGTIFSLWDRMRGSLVADPDAAQRPLGVPGEIDTYPQSWLEQLVEPFRSRPAGALAEGFVSRPAGGTTSGA